MKVDLMIFLDGSSHRVDCEINDFDYNKCLKIEDKKQDSPSLKTTDSSMEERALLTRSISSLSQSSSIAAEVANQIKPLLVTAEELKSEISRNVVDQLKPLLNTKKSPSKPDDGEDTFTLPHGIHSSVVCDQCSSSICGYRFKCGNCPNYDLCIDCFKAKTRHRSHDPTHVFLLIERPVSHAGWVKETKIFEPLLRENIYLKNVAPITDFFKRRSEKSPKSSPETSPTKKDMSTSTPGTAAPRASLGSPPSSVGAVVDEPCMEPTTSPHHHHKCAPSESGKKCACKRKVKKHHHAMPAASGPSEEQLSWLLKPHHGRTEKVAKRDRGHVEKRKRCKHCGLKINPKLMDLDDASQAKQRKLPEKEQKSNKKSKEKKKAESASLTRSDSCESFIFIPMPECFDITKPLSSSSTANLPSESASRDSEPKSNEILLKKSVPSPLDSDSEDLQIITASQCQQDSDHHTDKDDGDEARDETEGETEPATVNDDDGETGSEDEEETVQRDLCEGLKHELRITDYETPVEDVDEESVKKPSEPKDEFGGVSGAGQASDDPEIQLADMAVTLASKAYTTAKDVWDAIANSPVPVEGNPQASSSVGLSPPTSWAPTSTAAAVPASVLQQNEPWVPPNPTWVPQQNPKGCDWIAKEDGTDSQKEKAAVEKLLSMGFTPIERVQAALKETNYSVNEAAGRLADDEDKGWVPLDQHVV